MNHVNRSTISASEHHSPHPALLHSLGWATNILNRKKTAVPCLSSLRKGWVQLWDLPVLSAGLALQLLTTPPPRKPSVLGHRSRIIALSDPRPSDLVVETTYKGDFLSLILFFVTVSPNISESSSADHSWLQNKSYNQQIDLAKETEVFQKQVHFFS